PAILVVRLSVGGAPGRLGGAPPAVFRVKSTSVTPAAAASSPDPAAWPDPAASPDPAAASPDPAAALPASSSDPNATASSGPPAGSVSTTAEGAPATAPLAVAITAVTPVDAASRLLLNPAWKPRAIV